MDLLSFRLLFIGTVVLSRGDRDIAHCVGMWVCGDTDLVAQDGASPTQREKELSISI